MYSEDENLSVLKNDIITYSRHDLAVVREKHRNKLTPEYKRLHLKDYDFHWIHSFSPGFLPPPPALASLLVLFSLPLSPVLYRCSRSKKLDRNKEW